MRTLKNKLVLSLVRSFVLLLILTPATLLAQKESVSFMHFTASTFNKEISGIDKDVLDFYMPIKGGDLPVVIWMNGANGDGGNVKDIEAKATYFTSRGYLFVSLSLPYSENTNKSNELAKAIMWVYNNTVVYGGDNTRMFIMCYGAGAQLASLLLVDESHLKKAGGNSKVIKGAVLMDGVGYDLAAAMERLSKKDKERFVKLYGNVNTDWQKVSPVNYVSHSNIPYCMILNSGKNSFINEDAANFFNKLTEAKVGCKMMNYPDKSGSSLIRSIGEEGDKTTEDIAAFLRDKSYTSRVKM